MEKYRSYREEIKKGPKEIVEEKPTEAVSSVSVPKKTKEKKKKVVEKQHVSKKKEKVVKVKTIYDEYVVKKRLKRFLYVLGVLVFVTLLVFILVFVIKNYL